MRVVFVPLGPGDLGWPHIPFLGRLGVCLDPLLVLAINRMCTESCHQSFWWHWIAALASQSEYIFWKRSQCAKHQFAKTMENVALEIFSSVCVCVCVCMSCMCWCCVCIHVHVHVCVFVCVCACCVCVCVCVCCVCLCVLCVYACSCVLCVHFYACSLRQIYLWGLENVQSEWENKGYPTNQCIHVRMCVCVCVSMDMNNFNFRLKYAQVYILSI